VTFAQTVRIDLAYKGTDFRGFAENPGVRTVGGELRSALEQILGETIELTVAGRTDAGVHATGQVVSFRTGSSRLDCERLVVALNRMCSPDMRVHAVTAVNDDFNARFSASERMYHYTVLNAPQGDPLCADLEWHIPEPLNVDAMNQAAGLFLGEHDFTSFCRRPKGQPESVLIRKIRSAKWVPLTQERICFEIAANAFCHQMVRSLTGFCVAVGLGKCDANTFEAVLKAKDRAAAPPIAPPHGLVLKRVTYGAADEQDR
tara:strand:- start:697 stop:1476 length:780 start_codon:yes stop_codon:yes gene_type:complete